MHSGPEPQHTMVEHITQSRDNSNIEHIDIIYSKFWVDNYHTNNRISSQTATKKDLRYTECKCFFLLNIVTLEWWLKQPLVLEAVHVWVGGGEYFIHYVDDPDAEDNRVWDIAAVC